MCTTLVLLTVAVTFFSSCSAGSVGCGKQAPQYPPNFSSRARIVNGNETKPHSWPWTLSLQSSNQQRCGASLLRVKDNVEQSDIALTAAHCVKKIQENNNLKAYTIVAGNHHQQVMEAGQERIFLADYKIHEKYNKMDQIYDVTILKLVKPVNFGDTIRPVCLPTKGQGVPVGQQCVATGWGRISGEDAQLTADTLQQLVVQVHEQKQCRQKWIRVYNEELMMCAGVTDGSSSVCNGDSGGPLVCRASQDAPWVQHGVANFVGGMGSCDSKQPPVYARISVVVDWINDRVKEMSSIK